MCHGAAIEKHGDARKRTQPPPVAPGENQVEHAGGDRKYGRDQPLQQQAHADRGPQRISPARRMRLVFLERPRQAPHRHRDCQRQDGVGNLESRKQEQPDASRHRQPGVKPGLPSERPGAEPHRHPCQRDARQRQGNPRRPVAHAEQSERDGHHPIFEGGFFQVRDPVEPWRNPVSRLQHRAGDLRLHRVDIVHQGRWTDDTSQKNDRGDQEYDQFVRTAPASIPHLVIRRRKVSRTALLAPAA